MRIVISQTRNGYMVYEPDAAVKHEEYSVAETMESLMLVIADRFGVSLETKTEEKLHVKIEEIQIVENAPVNDDEEDDDIFIIPAAATGGGESIQDGEVCISEDAPDPASEERLSEPCSTDAGNPENDSEKNREIISYQERESIRTPTPGGPVSKGHERQSKVLKPQPYTPESTGLSEMQLSVLQIICHLVDLNQGPVYGSDINERVFPAPANLTTLVKPLIKKGFIKKRTEGRNVEYIPLKRPDGRKYGPLPVTKEDGVPVIHCEPRNIGSRSNSEGGLKI